MHLKQKTNHRLNFHIMFSWLPTEAKSQLYFDMLIPCKSKVTFVFGTWSPAEARSWPFLDFRLLAEAKSQLFVGMLTLWGNVTFVFWHLIPYRSKVLVILLFDSLQKQSHNHSLMCWSPAEERSHLYFGTWSPTEARSWPFFIFLFVCERTQSRIHTLLFQLVMVCDPLDLAKVST